MKKKNVNKKVKGLKVDKLSIEIPEKLPELKFPVSHDLPEPKIVKDGKEIPIQKFELTLTPQDEFEIRQMSIALGRGLASAISASQTYFQNGDKVRLNKEVLGDILCPSHFEDTYHIIACSAMVHTYQGRRVKSEHYLIALEGSEDIWGLTFSDWFDKSCLIIKEFVVPIKGE